MHHWEPQENGATPSDAYGARLVVAERAIAEARTLLVQAEDAIHLVATALPHLASGGDRKSVV